MTPFFENALRTNQHAIELHIGELPLQLVAGCTVLLLVPHVMVKDALCGSTSGLIIQQAKRLCALGMRPVVVTTGYGDVREGSVMRDSVCYIQAHQRWGVAQWQELFSHFEPMLCLSYANAMQGLELPEDIVVKMIEVGCEGLFDPIGVYHQFNNGNRWGCRVALAGQQIVGPRRINANQLSEAFFYRTEAPSELHRSGLRVLALAHDPLDFVALVQLMQVLPGVSFSLMSDFVYRGVEKNISLMPLGPLNMVHLAESDCLLQFSVKPSVLCAEAIMFMEHGKSVVAATSLAATSPLAAYCLAVSQPQQLTSWITVLKSIVRNRAVYLAPAIV